MKKFERYRNLYEKATQERPDIFKMNTGIAMITHMWNDKDYTVFINHVPSKFATKEEAEEFIFSKGYTIPCPSLSGYEKKFMNPEIRAEYDKAQQTIEEIKTATAELTNIIFDIVKSAGKKTYIRYGLLPESGRSYNFRENISENGVSCFEAYKFGNDYIIDVAGGYFTFLGYADSKIVYEITGEELLEKGSDGEPLLKDAKIIKQIRKTNRIYDIKSWIPTVFEKENPLKATEELIEGNANMIDGILNNEPPKKEPKKQEHQKQEPHKAEKKEKKPFTFSRSQLKRNAKRVSEQHKSDTPQHNRKPPEH